MGHVFSVQPFAGYLVAVDLTGAQVVSALENGVSAVENTEGRFPQVAGIRFTWDPKSPPGSRIKFNRGQDGEPAGSRCLRRHVPGRDDELRGRRRGRL